MNHKLKFNTALLIAVMLTLPLIGVFYLGDALFGLPFVPFDLFDWLARVLPGDVLTSGIDVMVDAIITLNLGETSSTAKTLEHLMGLGLFTALGAAVGTLILTGLHRTGDHSFMAMAGGLLLGIVLAFISMDVNFTASADPTISLVWILVVFIVWGMALNWAYMRLHQMAEEAVLRKQRYAEANQPLPANLIHYEKVNRREFLIKMGASTATLTVVGAGLGSLLEDAGQSVSVVQLNDAPPQSSVNASLPNADAAVIPAPGTRPEYTPLQDHYRIDISSRPPRIGETAYALEISGLVETPLNVPLSEIRDNYEPLHQYITLACISNRVAGDLISTTKWTGVPIQHLLDDWGVSPNATHMKISAADGFDECVDLELARQDERVMLAYAWDDQPLTQAHGFPLRIYIPERYGMKQPKWITHIEFTDAWGEGYWVRRGWSREALVNTTSVVDTVAAEHAYVQEGVTVIPIGGIAYASSRGISKVEVQVDNGDWVEADLRDPISETTWVIWRYDWPFEAGDHRFSVRCTDGNGDQQTSNRRSVRPDGATGLHSVEHEIKTT